MRRVASITGLFILFVAALFGITYCSMELEGFVKKKQTENRREAFENSEARILGTIETLSNLRREYAAAESEAVRSAIRQDVINETSAIKDELIRERNAELMKWVEKMRNEEFDPNQDLETSVDETEQ